MMGTGISNNTEEPSPCVFMEVDFMIILSHVAVEFHDIHGTPVFSVSKEQRKILMEAPEEIREDPIFEDLVKDGSLIVTENAQERKELEYDPTAGITAEGKAEKKVVKAKPKADAAP